MNFMMRRWLSSSLSSSLSSLSFSSIFLRPFPIRNASIIPKPIPLPVHEPTKFHPSIPLQVTKKEWTPQSKRVGAVGVKVGMTSLWDNEGGRHPVTVIQLQNTQVIQARTTDTDGFYSLQVGTGRKSTYNMRRSLINHFKKYGVTPKRFVREFQVTEDALLPPGFEIRAEHFVPGQYVDIQGTSIGKGFQGAMKRWGFGGLPASHGVSVSHRSLGSTGNRQDPGRVWKGKKMAGRMGGDSITILNLPVIKVDTVLNLIYVRGCVVGHKNSFVKIRDSNYKRFPALPPFPSYVRSPDQPLPRELALESFIPKKLDHVNNNWMNEPRSREPGSSQEPSTPGTKSGGKAAKASAAKTGAGAKAGDKGKEKEADKGKGAVKGKEPEKGAKDKAKKK